MTRASSSTQGTGLLDPAFLARLERLTLQARRVYAGREQGERKSSRRGTGLEFAAHRGYVAGDDLRHLDWALLGRLDRPFLKLYEQEEDLNVHLLIDASRSMGFGEPTKFDAARRIAAALAHIGLASLDRVGVAFFSGAGLHLHEAQRGRGALMPLLTFLEDGRSAGGHGIAEPLRLHASTARPGLTIVLSDFLEEDIENSLRPHLYRKHTLALVQILSRQETSPSLDGDLKLVDSETGSFVEATLGTRELNEYRRKLEEHQSRLSAFARRYGADHFVLPSELPLEEALWEHLLKGRFLQL